MIVAVTGANGFIGTNLCATLSAAGHEVRALLRADLAADRIESRLAGVDAVVHAAGATRAPSAAALRASHATLTGRVAQAARETGVGRFILISSQAAAGPARTRNAAVSEDDAPAPIDAYGEAKLEAERVVRDAGMPYTILRPAAVYGPHDRDFLAMFRVARRGIAIHPGNRDHWISIVHVNDVVRAVERALIDERALGRTYFVANSEPVTWRSLFTQAASASGTRLRLDVNIPHALVRMSAAAGDVVARVTGSTPLLSSGKIALSRPRYWICSNERAARELAFVPDTPLDDGFAATLRWYEANGWM